MRYLALTQGTAEWLRGKPELVAELSGLASTVDSTARALSDRTFIEGPFRMAADREATLIACWHTEYLSGTGDERWAFLELEQHTESTLPAEIAKEVVERFLLVASQRLQGYVLDAALMHRAHPNGAHTCLAGRGSVARQVSLGYFERNVGRGGSVVRAAVFVGPSRRIEQLVERAALVGRSLEQLVATA